MEKMKKISSKEFDELNESYRYAKDRSSQASLEAEYACLKALFLILDTNDFKYTDFDSISFVNNFEIQELELICDKFTSHKIVKNEDFSKQFKISPYAFVDFLRVNGAVNERDQKSKARPVGQYLHKEKIEVVPRVGDYFMCSVTGFWKKATKLDVEMLEVTYPPAEPGALKTVNRSKRCFQKII